MVKAECNPKYSLKNIFFHILKYVYFLRKKIENHNKCSEQCNEKKI